MQSCGAFSIRVLLRALSGASFKTLIVGCATPIFCACLCAKIRAAHSNGSDKVEGVPFCFCARGWAANKVRGQQRVKNREW